MHEKVCIGYIQIVCNFIYKGLEHVQIFGMCRGPGTNFLGIHGDDYFNITIAINTVLLFTPGKNKNVSVDLDNFQRKTNYFQVLNIKAGEQRRLTLIM